MEIETLLSGVFLLLLLILSAFFSGSETAFFSLNLLEKDKLKRRFPGRTGQFISVILDSPEDILITILTGNMFVNLFFASLMDRLAGNLVEENAWLYSILIGTIL